MSFPNHAFLSATSHHLTFPASGTQIAPGYDCTINYVFVVHSFSSPFSLVKSECRDICCDFTDSWMVLSGRMRCLYASGISSICSLCYGMHNWPWSLFTRQISTVAKLMERQSGCSGPHIDLIGVLLGLRNTKNTFQTSYLDFQRSFHKIAKSDY